MCPFGWFSLLVAYEVHPSIVYHNYVRTCDIISIFIAYNFWQFSVTAQQRPGIVIAYPGQDVELLCNVTPSGGQTTAWIINNVVHTVQQLHNGILTGYSTNGNNLIIENIMMSDDRNDSEYSCVIVPSTRPSLSDIVDESDPTFLYVAGEYQHAYIAS